MPATPALVLALALFLAAVSTAYAVHRRPALAQPVRTALGTATVSAYV